MLVADHLWEAFAAMAQEMGSDRDALVNQALYAFARLNGFVLPAVPRGTAAKPSATPPPPPPISDESSAPGAGQAGADRVAEIAQQIAAAGLSRQLSTPPPPLAPQAVPEKSPVEVDRALLPDEAARTSMDLPSLAALEREPAPVAAPQRPDRPVPATSHRTLVLLSAGRELERVAKDRFLIGRGKHCDLIINSGKVSREHAAIVREGSGWFIEDLGSSNGTWFEKQRIERRQIEDGDEYYICSEKLSCAFR